MTGQESWFAVGRTFAWSDQLKRAVVKRIVFARKGVGGPTQCDVTKQPCQNRGLISPLNAMLSPGLWR